MDYKAFPFYQRTNLDLLFSNLWEIFKRYFGWLFFYSFLLTIFSQAVATYVFKGELENLMNSLADPAAIGSYLKALVPYLLFIWIFISFEYLFLTSFVLGRYLEPEKSVMSILGTMMRYHYPKYLFVVLISYFIIVMGTTLGVFALIIGALVAFVFLGVSLMPVTSVMLVEDTGVFATIGRSFRLVLQDFWNVMAYTLLFLLLYGVAATILGLLAMAPAAGTFLRSILHPGSGATEALSKMAMMDNPLYLILDSLANALLLPFLVIFPILIYFHLKYLEDKKQEMQETTHNESLTR